VTGRILNRYNARAATRGSGANFKKGRRAEPGALGERESLACQIGPKFKLCTRSLARTLDRRRAPELLPLPPAFSSALSFGEFVRTYSKKISSYLRFPNQTDNSRSREFHGQESCAKPPGAALCFRAARSSESWRTERRWSARTEASRSAPPEHPLVAIVLPELRAKVRLDRSLRAG
jgi:hypothetical protein